MIRATMLMALMIAAPLSVRSQCLHFSFSAGTGLDAIVAIPVSSTPMIDTVCLTPGDEIGAFTVSGMCVGGVIWNGTNCAVTVWGDNVFTPEVDGITIGEHITFRLWSHSTDIEYASVQTRYVTGPDVFVPNGIAVIASMTAVLPHVSTAPVLLTPVNDAIEQPQRVMLHWQQTAHAAWYEYQLSSDSLFATLCDSGSVAGACSTQTLMLDNHTTYYWRVRSASPNGKSVFSSVYHFTTTAAVSHVSDGKRTASEFKLEQNFPNPFNPETSIWFSIPSGQRVNVTVYDMLGRVSAVLVDGELLPGWYQTSWSAAGLASGMYLCRMQAGSYVSVKRMVLTK